MYWCSNNTWSYPIYAPVWISRIESVRFVWEHWSQLFLGRYSSTRNDWSPEQITLRTCELIPANVEINSITTKVFSDLWSWQRTQKIFPIWVENNSSKQMIQYYGLNSLRRDLCLKFFCDIELETSFFRAAFMLRKWITKICII
jgi:hypothetical protein